MARRKKKPGRKKFKFDLEQVEKLAGWGAADKHIAAFFGVHPDTVSDHKRDDPKFRAALEKGRAHGDMDLLEMAFERAKTRDSLLIFLLKNRLGYQDNPLVSVTVNQADVTDDVHQLKEQAADILRRDGWVVEMPASESVH